MDSLLALKPVLTTLVLPACSGLLLTLALLLWAWHTLPHPTSNPHRQARFALAAAGAVTVVVGLLSCQAVAIGLSLHLLPQVNPVNADTIGPDFKRHHVQAIVVLGGGVENEAVEYNGPTLSPDAMSRLLYGVHLARTTQLPMVYSGGVGWAGDGGQASEAEVANRVLSRLGALPLRWQENQSRDTRENARLTAAMLKNEGITHIALVTHAWHMPRSVRQFEAAGLQVTPAPMGYIRSSQSALLQWLPSGTGLRDSGWGFYSPEGKCKHQLVHY